MRMGVIFDMDGVLVDSGEPHRRSWRVLAAKHGIELSDEAFAETFGMPSRDIIRKIWGENVDDDRVRAIDEEKEAVYRDLVRDDVPLSPGVRETLARLADARFVLAVGTSGPPENLDLVLEACELRHFFAATVNGFEIERGKPAPDVFLEAAARIELPPSVCAVVEDAPVGVEAGRAAGMPVIGYTGSHAADRLREAGADVIIGRLTDITPELVRELSGRRR